MEERPELVDIVLVIVVFVLYAPVWAWRRLHQPTRIGRSST